MSPIQLTRLVSLAAFLLISRAHTAPTTPTFPYDVVNAIIYGYPLTLYVQTYYPVIEAQGANSIRHDNTTASSSKSSLVRPNANYVYSSMAIDLSTSNVVDTIPNITDGRSFVYPFYDLYGELVAAIGSATDSPAGDYLLRPAYPSQKSGLTLYNSSDASWFGSPYQGVIAFPGAYGSLKARLLLRNNGSDLNNVHRYQNETAVKTIPRAGTSLAPPLTPSLLRNGSLSKAAYSNPRNISQGNATELLTLLAKLAPCNPPAIESYRFSVGTMLAGAGIGNGSYMGSASGFNESLVGALIGENLNRYYPQNDIYWNDLGRDWWNYKPSVSGDYGLAYGIRAETAYIGYLEMDYTQALYPEYLPPSSASSDGLLTLTSNQSYLFTFSRRPPAQFWSFTLYGSNNYLIPNALERYQLGCTDTSLTYANGTQVYPTGQDNTQRDIWEGGEGEEEEFQILIQPANQAPPANWTGNWLPCQAGGGSFSVNFRTYGPSPAMSNGSYIYPFVTKQGVIV